MIKSILILVSVFAMGCASSGSLTTNIGPVSVDVSASAKNVSASTSFQPCYLVNLLPDFVSWIPFVDDVVSSCNAKPVKPVEKKA